MWSRGEYLVTCLNACPIYNKWIDWIHMTPGGCPHQGCSAILHHFQSAWNSTSERHPHRVRWWHRVAVEFHVCPSFISQKAQIDVILKWNMKETISILLLLPIQILMLVIHKMVANWFAAAACPPPVRSIWQALFQSTSQQLSHTSHCHNLIVERHCGSHCLQNSALLSSHLVCCFNVCSSVQQCIQYFDMVCWCCTHQRRATIFLCHCTKINPLKKPLIWQQLWCRELTVSARLSFCAIKGYSVHVKLW